MVESQLDLKILPQHGGNRLWAATIGGCLPEQILDFSASLNPLGPPDSVKQALQAAVIADNPVAIAAYPEPGSFQLRQAIAGFYHLDPESILVGNGAAELLTWAAWDSRNLEAVLLPVPSFGDYQRALKAVEVKILPLLLPKKCQPRLADLISQSLVNQALTPQVSPDQSLGLWLNNPHNPTGYFWARAELLEILECLPQFDLVVVDEAFMDFLPATDQSLMSWVERFPQLVVIRSLTKFYTLPGLRIGFAVGHPDRLRRWQQWRDPWSVNGLATVAGLAALQDQDFQQRTHAWLGQARSHLWQGLQQLPGCDPWPSVANFILARCQFSVTDLQKSLLLQDQILIRDCLSFPELGDSYLRVAVRTLPQQEKLLAACQRYVSQRL